MTRTLKRPEDAHAWELRGAWAKQNTVRLTLQPGGLIRTIVGKVETVAATGAFVTVDGWHVPMYMIDAIGKPTPQDKMAYKKTMRELPLEALGMQ